MAISNLPMQTNGNFNALWLRNGCSAVIVYEYIAVHNATLPHRYENSHAIWGGVTQCSCHPTEVIPAFTPVEAGTWVSWPRHCSKCAQPVPKTAYHSNIRDKHNRPQWESNLGPLTPQSGALGHRDTWNRSLRSEHPFTPESSAPTPVQFMRCQRGFRQ